MQFAGTRDTLLAQDATANAIVRNSNTEDVLGKWLLGIFIFRLCGTLSPFARADHVDGSGGSSFNQIYWLSIVAIAGLVMMRNPATFRAVVMRSWPLILPIVWFVLSCFWSAYVGVALRRTTLFVLIFIIGLGIASANLRPATMLNIITLVLGAIAFVDLASCYVVPGLARNPGDGAFIGIHTHKNTAGVIAALAFLSWAFMSMASQQINRRLLYGIGAVAWFWFLLHTQSKTSLGGAVLTFALCICVFYWRLRIVETVALIVVGGSAGLLAALVTDTTWADIGVAIFNDLTFTGRVDLWAHLLDEIEKKPILGVGYGSFYHLIEGVPNGLIFAEGWAAKATSSHNGYIDVVLHTGLIGLVFCLIPTILLYGQLFANLRNATDPMLKWGFMVSFSFISYLIVRAFMEADFFRAGSTLTGIFLMIFLVSRNWELQDEQDQEEALAEYRESSAAVR